MEAAIVTRSVRDPSDQIRLADDRAVIVGHLSTRSAVIAGA